MSDSTPKRAAAFFDMDYTLVCANTAAMYVKYLYRHGLTSRMDVLRTVWWSLRFRLGVLDLRDVVARVVANLEGDSEEELR